MPASESDVTVNAWVCDAGHYHVRTRHLGRVVSDEALPGWLAPGWLKEQCRDELGRFAPCGGAASGARPEHGVGRTAEHRARVAAERLAKAHELVKAIRARDRGPTLQETAALHDHLGTLTVAQLKGLRDAYGLKASGNKADLKAKIAVRLRALGLAAAPRAAAEPDHVPAGTYGPSKATITTNEVMADQHAAAVLGPGKKARDLLSVSGAPDGAKAQVYKTAGMDEVQVQFRGETDKGVYSGSRTISRDPDGAVSVHNNFFEGEGVGLEMFGRQVENATLHGVDHIETHAAGQFVRGPDPNKSYGTFNGYYTWPRFGYDDKVPGGVYELLGGKLKADVDRAGGNVRGLMGSDEGRKWWLKNGENLNHARFDLKPGSYSQRTLAAYLKTRGVLK